MARSGIFIAAILVVGGAPVIWQQLQPVESFTNSGVKMAVAYVRELQRENGIN